MITFCACVVMAIESQADLVAASLFKNGYAFTIREIKVDGPSTVISKIPSYSLGTFWLTPSGGAQMVSLVNSQKEVDRSAPIGDLSTLYSQNIGQEVTVLQSGFPNGFDGKLVAVLAESIVIQGDLTRVIPKNEIRQLIFRGNPKTNISSKGFERVLVLESTGRGSFLMYGLERGMTWAPAYQVDISDSKTARLSMRATVLNDLDHLKNGELRFITGFPNIPFTRYSEPIFSAMSVDQFVNMLSGLGYGQDQFAGRREMMTQNMAPRGGGGGEMPEAPETEQSEDLFFYKLSGANLKKGDRALYVIANSTSPYEDIYSVTFPPDMAAFGQYVRPEPQRETPYDVWHTIKFINKADQPLTTAPVTVVKNGQIMGQDTLMYTSAGSTIDVKMSKALDIRAEIEDEEQSRDRNALKLSGTDYDLVTVKSTITLMSRKAQPVKLMMSREYSGDLISAEGSHKNTKVVKGFGQVNTQNKIEWSLNLQPAKETKIAFSYKLLVRT